MDEQFRQSLFEQAKKWILEAGEYIRNRIDDPLTIDTKADPNDLVTTMDKNIEKFFAKKIKHTYTDHLLFGEEGYGDEITTLRGKTVWIIDPIDGTMNFVHQKRKFAISVGIFHNEVGEIGLIYDVMKDVLYSAVRGNGAYKNNKRLPFLDEQVNLGQSILGMNHFWLCENHLVDEKLGQSLVKTVRGVRTYGSAALELAYVAEGVMDGYLALSLSPWDFAAGLIIVHEVGGITTNIAGEKIDLLRESSILACNQQIHPSIVSHFM